MRRLTSVGTLLLALAALASLPSCESPPSSAPGSGHSNLGLDASGNRPGPRGFTTVVVDAGHGGKDSGTISRRNGLTEKNLTLDVARRLRTELGGQFRVVMTRDSDTFVELDDRVAIANRYGNGILVSIHFNECTPDCSGPETYWWRVDSSSLAKRVEQHLSAVAPFHNNRYLIRRRLHLTRNPGVPCILVECGYVTNSREATLISTSAYRNKIAAAIAAGIRDQAAIGDAGMGPLPPFIQSPLSYSSGRRR